MLRAVALALALVGCAGANPHPDQAGVTFGPGADGPGVRAIGRICAATGVCLAVAPDGVPVSLVSTINYRGPACGITRTVHRATVATEIQIATEQPNCLSVEDTILHELLHLISLPLPEHARDGVFGAKAADGRITAGTLETVCSAAACSRFQPEE